MAGEGVAAKARAAERPPAGRPERPAAERPAAARPRERAKHRAHRSAKVCGERIRRYAARDGQRGEITGSGNRARTSHLTGRGRPRVRGQEMRKPECRHGVCCSSSCAPSGRCSVPPRSSSSRGAARRGEAWDEPEGANSTRADRTRRARSGARERQQHPRTVVLPARARGGVRARRARCWARHEPGAWARRERPGRRPRVHPAHRVLRVGARGAVAGGGSAGHGQIDALLANRAGRARRPGMPLQRDRGRLRDG